MSKTLFMETTKIDPQRTIAEITNALREYGVTAVLTEYTNGQIEALSFKIQVDGQELPFRLPCRWIPLADYFYSCRKREPYYDVDKKKARQEDEEKAKRVGWRQILRWVEAQLALTDTKMAKIEEVFLPYLQAPNGKTLFESLESTGYKMLEGPTR